LDVNPALVEMLGFPDKESFKKIKSFDVYVDPQKRENLKTHLEKEGVVYGYQARFKRRDGKIIWVKMTTRAIRDNVGKIIRYEGAIEDITQQKESEEALRQSETFLENVLYSIQDGISVLDTDLNIIMTNRVMEDWYASNLPLVGKKCYQAYHNSSHPCHPCPSLRCLKSGRTEKEIVPGLKGSPVEWIELFSYPLKDPLTGEIEGVVEFVRDITPQKKAEELIQKSLEEKEILLQEIHHRVKNNLQIIISLLRLQASSEEDARLINMFRECQNRIMAMAFVHEKLYQSRDFTRVNFTQYIHDFAQELGTAFGVQKKGIELITELEEIELDINRAIPCGLIFNELLTNAIQHAFPGKKKGEIIIRLQREDKDQISFEVRDSGVGLPDNFDLDMPKTLGLMLVKSLTAQINGHLVIDRTNGTGFKIIFPG
jgi:PAS domain S-box-containing protein